jgi:hypothetical protein|tara:strand:+ start:397 stop:555 length:159 start_codon:yes stop_codon:yes gene_type:complete
MKDVFVNYFVTADRFLLNIMSKISRFFDQKRGVGHDLVRISNIGVDNFVHGL